MAQPVDFHRLARREIRVAQQRYTRLGDALGRRCFDALFVTLERVENRPMTCSPHSYGTRIAPLRKFPYWVVSAEQSDGLFVLALMHKSRRPGYWRRRKP